MKTKIITNTILFICIMLFIVIFTSVFGEGNSLVGVAVVIEVLILMGEDLATRPVQNLMKLLTTNVLLGIAAFVASHHIVLGIIFNFLALAMIGYFCTYKLNKALTVPFGLLYLFMLYTPVEGVDLAKRYMALIFGALCVMGFQMLIHRKKKSLKVEKSNLICYKEYKSSYKIYKIGRRYIRINVVGLKYAIRTGVLVAITAFIAGAFNLSEGRWMSYTVFSLTELYADRCRVKSKDRLQGTLIGAVIIVILFMFIKDFALRSLIVLVLGYANSFTNNYRDSMICVTASVIASMALTNNSVYIALERIMYVAIGVGIALVANQFLLRVQDDGPIA